MSCEYREYFKEAKSSGMWTIPEKSSVKHANFMHLYLHSAFVLWFKSFGFCLKADSNLHSMSLRSKSEMTFVFFDPGIIGIHSKYLASQKLRFSGESRLEMAFNLSWIKESPISLYCQAFVFVSENKKNIWLAGNSSEAAFNVPWIGMSISYIST